MSSTRPAARRLTSTALLLSLTVTPLMSACASHTPVAFQGTQADSVALRGKSKVTLLAGPTVYLESAALVRDSIIGQQRETGGSTYQRKSIALADIREIERQYISSTKTILLVGAVFAVAVVLTVISMESMFSGGLLCGTAC